MKSPEHVFQRQLEEESQTKRKVLTYLLGVAVLPFLDRVPFSHASSDSIAPKSLEEEKIFDLAKIYLDDARKNIVYTRRGKKVAIIPSAAYPECYLRDAFFALSGLNDRELFFQGFDLFEKNIEEVSGQVPTAVSFNNKEKNGVQDDESNLLFILWTGLVKRGGKMIDQEKVEQVYLFVKTHIEEGFYTSPSGAFRYWADTIYPERPEKIAYNQGFYAVALRMLSWMGVGNVTSSELGEARKGYRSFYNHNSDYVTLGKDSYFRDCQDVSALLPEFFSRFLFNEPILSDREVLDTVDYHLGTGAVYDSKNKLAGIKVISFPGGEFLPREKFSVPDLNPAGGYHNGGYWPMYTLVELSLAYKISLREEYVKAARQLLWSEFGRERRSKEFIYLSPERIGSFDSYRSVYSWNALIYRAFAWSGLLYR